MALQEAVPPDWQTGGFAERVQELRTREAFAQREPSKALEHTSASHGSMADYVKKVVRPLSTWPMRCRGT